jgi:hypothetical protein
MASRLLRWNAALNHYSTTTRKGKCPFTVTSAKSRPFNVTSCSVNENATLDDIIHAE